MSFIRKIKRGNSVYLAEVENHRNAEGKVVQKHIRYIGKEVDVKAAHQSMFISYAIKQSDMPA